MVQVLSTLNLLPDWQKIFRPFKTNSVELKDAFIYPWWNRLEAFKFKFTRILLNFNSRCAIIFPIYFRFDIRININVGRININVYVFTHMFVYMCWVVTAASTPLKPLRLNYLDKIILKMSFFKKILLLVFWPEGPVPLWRRPLWRAAARCPSPPHPNVYSAWWVSRDRKVYYKCRATEVERYITSLSSWVVLFFD